MKQASRTISDKSTVDQNTHGSDVSGAALTAAGWKSRDMPGFMGLAGPLWTRRIEDSGEHPASWQFGLLVQERHLNPVGIVHGGALTTLIDHAVSLQAWSHSGRQPCVTVELTTHFVGAAREGEFLVADAQVTHATRSMLFLRGAISVEDRPVLLAQAIMKVTRS